MSERNHLQHAQQTHLFAKPDAAATTSDTASLLPAPAIAATATSTTTTTHPIATREGKTFAEAAADVGVVPTSFTGGGSSDEIHRSLSATESSFQESARRSLHRQSGNQHKSPGIRILGRHFSWKFVTIALIIGIIVTLLIMWLIYRWIKRQPKSSVTMYYDVQPGKGVQDRAEASQSSTPNGSTDAQSNTLESPERIDEQLDTDSTRMESGAELMQQEKSHDDDSEIVHNKARAKITELLGYSLIDTSDSSQSEAIQDVNQASSPRQQLNNPHSDLDLDTNDQTSLYPQHSSPNVPANASTALHHSPPAHDSLSPPHIAHKETTSPRDRNAPDANVDARLPHTTTTTPVELSESTTDEIIDLTNDSTEIVEDNRPKVPCTNGTRSVQPPTDFGYSDKHHTFSKQLPAETEVSEDDLFAVEEPPDATIANNPNKRRNTLSSGAISLGSASKMSVRQTVSTIPLAAHTEEMAEAHSGLAEFAFDAAEGMNTENANHSQHTNRYIDETTSRTPQLSELVDQTTQPAISSLQTITRKSSDRNPVGEAVNYDDTANDLGP